MPLKLVEICVKVDEKGEVELVNKRVQKWQDKFRRIRRKGCGCCVNISSVIVPSSAVDELPDGVITSCEKYN